MTFEARVAAVASHRFTARQAAFLTMVMLHAGVCLQRQYASFVGRANGHNTREFFNRLERDRLATAHACWRHGGRLYHIHHKALYRAIGERDNRHRRPTTVARAIERLMVLDVVLSSPDTMWLGTEPEKVAHFVHQRGVPTADLPALVFEAQGTSTTRYFPDKLPIGISCESPTVVFVFPAVDAEDRTFGRFLDRHSPLFRRLDRWTLRVVFPSFLATARNAYTQAFTAFCAPPIRPAIVEEFRWFCHMRRELEGPHVQASTADSSRYQTARRAFGIPRFFETYRRWRESGDAALHHLLSPRLHDGVRRGDIRLETYVLPHQYQHLASVVSTA